jgi:hypothetical protein
VTIFRNEIKWCGTGDYIFYSYVNRIFIIFNFFFWGGGGFIIWKTYKSDSDNNEQLNELKFYRVDSITVL